MRIFCNKIPLAFIGLVFLGGVITGCDDSGPTSVEDFDIQGTMDSPSGLTVSGDVSPEFSVTYQGLAEAPSVQPATDEVSVETLSEEGDPKEGGSSRWRVSLAANTIEQPIKEVGVVVSAPAANSDRTITDTVSAFTTTKLAIQSSFGSDFISFADYEGDVVSGTYCGEDPSTESYGGNQRTVQTADADQEILTSSGGNNQPQGSNGVSYLQVDNNAAGGSVTIRRRMNLPNADQFSFLIRSEASQAFSLTLGFTEVTDGTDGGSGAETTTHEFSLPLLPGVGWLKISIPFSEIADNFNPVSPRSGGNGPLMSVTLTADAASAYSTDEMTFGIEGTGPRAELHDFDRTPCAYGPPFSGGTFGFTGDVAAGSDGYTARTLDAVDFFGYNQPPAFLDVDGDDVLSFYGKGVDGARDLTVFLEGPGGFEFGNNQTVTLPDGQWQRFEIPLSDLGNDPSALTAGLGNVGFNGCENCVLDDVKVMPK